MKKNNKLPIIVALGVLLLLSLLVIIFLLFQSVQSDQLTQSPFIEQIQSNLNHIINKFIPDNNPKSQQSKTSNEYSTYQDQSKPLSISNRIYSLNSTNEPSPTNTFWYNDKTLTISGKITKEVSETDTLYLIPIETLFENQTYNILVSVDKEENPSILTLKLPGGIYENPLKWRDTHMEDLKQYMTPDTQIMVDIETSKDNFFMKNFSIYGPAERFTIPVPMGTVIE